MADEPGRLMRAEIAEQPGLLSAAARQRTAVAEVAARISARPPRFVLLAARGSSDHAALYAKYLCEVLLQLPCGLVSPSTTTLYGARPDLSGVLWVAVSQSGGSPDLVEATRAAREQGALTVAVTNTPASPLAGTTELAVDIGAGPELAVAATKTYSATLMALYLLVDAVRGGDGEHAAALGDLAAEALESTAAATGAAAERLRFVDRMITTGRGYSSATAAEAALKLAETSYLSARSHSGADLLHGPVAAIDGETAALAISSAGAGGTALGEVLPRVRAHGAELISVGSLRPAVESLHIPLPGTAEEVAPILEVLPVQSLALRLALARGVDPDQPRGLDKVTRTR
ncbi:SIS domain-containing protein [Actinokineospora pegani]|uniref:SIS domain-containing protein n=1 Tax=Actinokineospora pegani TaxID=2654637 RepID=UPI001F20DB4D|nr:SIS domain-containing protein [Actinokineospora pegani]